MKTNTHAVSINIHCVLYMYHMYRENNQCMFKCVFMWGWCDLMQRRHFFPFGIGLMMLVQILKTRLCIIYHLGIDNNNLLRVQCLVQGLTHVARTHGELESQPPTLGFVDYFWLLSQLNHSRPLTFREMPGIEPRASYMQSMHSTSELHPLFLNVRHPLLESPFRTHIWPIVHIKIFISAALSKFLYRLTDIFND